MPSDLWRCALCPVGIVIPRRYLIATLFIAALLVLLAIVQAPRSLREGGVGPAAPEPLYSLDSFETLAECPLRDGWAPRFEGALDPDQPDPWPFPGGFGAPWEPASPYLADQGIALNGPDGRSEVVLLRGLEWRHYRFDTPLVSARLEPRKGRHLLVTLKTGAQRFETRLLEVPEGRALWAVDSGPWSRFSWDGKGVLLGLLPADQERGLLLASLPVEGDLPESTLAAWAEEGLPGAPRGWPVREDQLGQAGQDLKGHRLLVPWRGDGRLWFPRADRLWISEGGQWALWELVSAGWRRMATGTGILAAQPPIAMGLTAVVEETAMRKLSSVLSAQWEPVPPETAPWPVYDPAWIWGRSGALTAWDLRWGTELVVPKERQRDALTRVFRSEWKLAAGLRASVGGWLPQGPEVALREREDVAWVWVGNRILLVRIQSGERARKLKYLLEGR